MFLPDPVAIMLAVLVFVPLERLFALHREQRIFRKLWQTDTLHMLMNTVFVGFGISLLLLGALSLTPYLVPESFRSWVGAQPYWIQLPAMIVLSDLGFYAVHRLFHKIPWLWKFHAVHHSIEEMDWLAAHRVHPIDQILTKGVSLLPVFALGFSAWPIAAYVFLYHWQSLLIHSNVRLGFGPLDRIVATPRFHHWHHANHPAAYDKNFAGQLSFLDALFGTMHMPAAAMPRRYGTNEPVPLNYGGQLAFPFQQTADGARPQPGEEMAGTIK